MGLEYEQKYAADADIQAAVRKAYPGPWRRIEMETVYYDTPDGALAKRGITLRRRLENGTPVCTVKTPAGENGRGEWECPCESVRKAIPILCGMGCPPELIALAAPGLTVLCGASFTRWALTIPQADCTVELALDSGMLTGGGRTAPLCEIEVELKSGDRAGADRFAAALAGQFGLPVEPKSKFRRAMALAKGE